MILQTQTLREQKELLEINILKNSGRNKKPERRVEEISPQNKEMKEKGLENSRQNLGNSISALQGFQKVEENGDKTSKQ